MKKILLVAGATLVLAG
ncbi:lipoprotein, partial [Salmonella enterica]